MTSGGFIWLQREMYTLVLLESWGFVFISWQELNLKVIILVGVVVQKTDLLYCWIFLFGICQIQKSKGTLFTFTKLHCFVLCE